MSGCRPVKYRRMVGLMSLDSRLVHCIWQCKILRSESHDFSGSLRLSRRISRMERIRILVAERLSDAITYGVTR